MFINIKNCISLLLIYVLSTQVVFSLELDSRRDKNNNLGNPSEFVFQSYPNQQLIPIRLLGEVKKAGLYYVPVDLKLITLLSLAGGTTTEANLEKVHVSNDQAKVKDHSGLEKDSLTIDLEKTFSDGAKTDYSLKANDIVLIESKKPFISSDSFRVITILSLLLTSALTAITIKDKL